MKVEIRLAAKSGAGSQLFPHFWSGAPGKWRHLQQCYSRFGGELHVISKADTLLQCESVELLGIRRM